MHSREQKQTRTHRSLDIPTLRSHGTFWPSCMYCMYPFDKCTTLGEKQSICDVFRATELHHPAVPRSVLCADSYYLQGQPFLCSIKGDRFKALTDRLQEKVRQSGEWYSLHNEMMVHHYSNNRIVRHKTLLTNALVCNKSMKQSKYRPRG